MIHRAFIIILTAAMILGCGSQGDAEPDAQSAGRGEESQRGGGMVEAYWLGFNSTRSGNYDVFIMDFDSAPPVQLTDDPATDWVYAADEMMYVASDREEKRHGGEYDLYLLDPYDSSMTMISKFPVYDSWLGVSPTRDTLAICSKRDGKKEIYLIDRQGNELAKLTDGDWEDSDPDWSPDGNSLVFRSNRTGAWEIWRMNVDGSNADQLTVYADNDAYHGYGGEMPPRWSPDGKRIMWSSFRDDQWDIYVMDADGGNVTNLTNTPDIDETWPSWSPNGYWIAFDAEIEADSENYEIYIMYHDGSKRQRMTHNDALDLAPVWVTK